jgi:hypothetical protein
LNAAANVIARGFTVNSEPNALFGKCPVKGEKRESTGATPAQQDEHIIFLMAHDRRYFAIRDRIMKDIRRRPMTIIKKSTPY